MSQPFNGGSPSRGRRGGGSFGGNRSNPPNNHPLQRIWQCPSCGRTRPGASAMQRAPLCRQDLSEMRIALVPAQSRGRPFYRNR